MSFINKCPKCSGVKILENFEDVVICSGCGADFPPGYIDAFWNGYTRGYSDCIEKFLPLSKTEEEYKIFVEKEMERINDEC